MYMINKLSQFLDRLKIAICQVDNRLYHAEVRSNFEAAKVHIPRGHESIGTVHPNEFPIV